MAISAGQEAFLRTIPWRVVGWGSATLLLVLPAIANAPWSPADYVFAGVLLGSVGLGLELAVRKGNAAYTLAAGIALAAAALLLIINGAVGIIGSERDDANLLFLGVVFVAASGAIAARFRPTGMARAMMAAALAQLSVPALATVLGLASKDLLLQPEVPVLTGVFVALWLASAWLFRKG